MLVVLHFALALRSPSIPCSRRDVLAAASSVACGVAPAGAIDEPRSRADEGKPFEWSLAYNGASELAKISEREQARIK